MLNPSLDAYGIGKPLTAVQKVAGGIVTSATAVAGAGAVTESDGTTKATTRPEVSQQQLSEAVNKLNEFVAPALQSIQFSMDQDSNRMIVKVVDTSTQKVLRQIPNEEVLAISRTLDKLQGLVIRQTA